MTVGRASRSSPPRPPGRRRARARRGEGDRLREEILQATAELLLEKGSAAKVSTRAVAQRVGVSSPALYLHFPDKASLVYAVCEQQYRQLGQLIDEALAGVADPVERLRRAAHTYTRFALDHPEQYRIMMMDEEYGKAFTGSLADFGDQAGMTSILGAITDGMASGLFREADPVNTAIGLWGAIHGLVSLRLAKPGLPLPPIEELVDSACELITHGMRVRPEDGEAGEGGAARGAAAPARDQEPV